MIDLRHVLLRLCDVDFDFVIVGGYAAASYGSTLVTEDLDICADFSETNLLKLGTALSDLHPKHRMTPKKIPLELSPEFCRGLKNLFLQTDQGQLDVLSEILGIGTYEDVLRHSTTVELMGRQIRILSLDALIRAKEALNRPRDKEAVIQLRAIRDRRA